MSETQCETGIERYWREQEQAELQFEHQIRALADITLAKRRADVEAGKRANSPTWCLHPKGFVDGYCPRCLSPLVVGLSGLTPLQYASLQLRIGTTRNSPAHV